jgi:hypothetical protein
MAPLWSPSNANTVPVGVTAYTILSAAVSTDQPELVTPPRPEQPAINRANRTSKRATRPPLVTIFKLSTSSFAPSGEASGAVTA